ncbi:hypothetical protein [Sphingomonas faeni]|uniref:hypothetical protein n=1 Tax=Sphingomonas faeni TaxID=185950 RepID=UPI002789738B|nr:hypothetical protein [Sphingomonas faeni]MDQ0839833.1 hypothetical protein [Sphingomonas faeni]
MTPLVNRRILLIGIGFYDYERVIADEFKRLGAQVLVEYESAPESRGLLAPIKRRLSPVSDAHLARHHAGILERSQAIGTLDYVVVIKGTLLGEAFLRTLKAKHRHACFVSYQWDSMARFPELVDRQRVFDRVLTFDQADAATYPDFIFRPTFFRPELLTAEQLIPIDLCFVGWLHHDRLKQVEALREQADSLGLSSFFYLFTGVRTGLEILIQGRGKDVHVRTLPFARYARYIASSKIIVDLPHPDQAGLTMRAAEAVGTGKKLMTTAKSVSVYDFYRPENVSIIDAASPRLDPEFLSVAYTDVDKRLVERYSLRVWALDVLGLTEPTGFLAKSAVGRV